MKTIILSLLILALPTYGAESGDFNGLEQTYLAFSALLATHPKDDSPDLRPLHQSFETFLSEFETALEFPEEIDKSWNDTYLALGLVIAFSATGLYAAKKSDDVRNFYCAAALFGLMGVGAAGAITSGFAIVFLNQERNKMKDQMNKLNKKAHIIRTEICNAKSILDEDSNLFVKFPFLDQLCSEPKYSHLVKNN